jgi:hypothetical protein
LPTKPVERRTLHCPTSSAPQGKLDLWVDLLPLADAKKNPPVNICPIPPMLFEVRVIVWGTREITIMDEITQQNDLYVTCHCQGPNINQKESTDTHLRSKNGLANFNWRMIYPMHLPGKTWPRLRFQVWDKDFFSSNDSICETILSLKGLCKHVLKTGRRTKVVMNKSQAGSMMDVIKNQSLGDKDKFWLENLQHPNHPGKSQGRLQISIEMMPASIAALLPAGPGQQPPNSNPFLPPPEGRVHFSLFHPLDMLREILGPQMYHKICFACCAILCVAMIAGIFPTLISQIIAKHFF